jgi:hypothetical protein
LSNIAFELNKLNKNLKSKKWLLYKYNFII